MMEVISTYEITGMQREIEHVCGTFGDEFNHCKRCQVDGLVGLSELADTLESNIVAEEIRWYILQIAGNIGI